jgi:hypothetical protein
VPSDQALGQATGHWGRFCRFLQQVYQLNIKEPMFLLLNIRTQFQLLSHPYGPSLSAVWGRSAHFTESAETLPGPFRVLQAAE